ncbi:hypothetical protein Q8F55_001624 [Vanrija albida]|uniref:Pyoverdine/dityrosine biosynthesis protein n=1 Tax=Vanrija albida TaxID=181172 RepID=A0ABR3QGP4_9TREE
MTILALPTVEGDGVDAARLSAYLTTLSLAAAESIPPTDAAKAPDTIPITDSITSVFERHLKYTPASDQWLPTGRARFVQSVERFVAANRPVEFVLPAFPCKSSNRNKVIGVLPDKGEELGLRTMKLFADAVSRVYAPGVVMRIVSDGHVFSDLVGTDDGTVDAYNQGLLEMSAGVSPDRELFRFAGLDDLLQLKSLDRHEDRWAAPPSGPLATTRTPQAERGRAILMQLFGKMGSIEERMAKDPALMALCRGFSKFVYEDTLQHHSLASMSRSKQKKVAWETAKLMILRNEAYSKLVEVAYPAAVRLSIHP